MQNSENKSRLFEYASQELFRVLQLEESDPLLYSTAVKRFTPNVRALYAWAYCVPTGIEPVFRRFSEISESLLCLESGQQSVPNTLNTFGICCFAHMYSALTLGVNLFTAVLYSIGRGGADNG